MESLNRKALPLYLGVIFLNAQGDLGIKVIFQNGVFKLFNGPELLFWGSFVNLLMLIPFILFYPLALFLSLRFPKLKILEVMALGGIFIAGGVVVVLGGGHFWEGLLLLFGMALQSALFSPAKYGVIRELFGDRNIAGVNGWVQGVTIGGILGGTLFYSALFELLVQEGGAEVIGQSVAPVGGVVTITLLLEWWLARRLSKIAPFSSTPSLSSPSLRFPLSKTQYLLIGAISLFWGVSQLVVALFGEYLKGLGVTNSFIPQLIVGLTGIGVGIGAVIAGKTSYWRRLIPVGALLIALSLGAIPVTENLYLLGGLALLYGIGGGLYLVPLNSLLQLSAPTSQLGGVLAKSNFFQYLTMVGALGVGIGASLIGLSSRPLFFGSALLFFGVALLGRGR
jgi:acyl-[acyl-carrier-protein]-phospholipid O-acyltransferase/long-chain-fatty-acid--[acyl-carrier-protein] ligase